MTTARPDAHGLSPDTIAERIIAALTSEDARAIERWSTALVGDSEAWPLVPPLRNIAEALALCTLADALQADDATLSDRAAWLEAGYLVLGDDANSATAPADIVARRLRRWLRRVRTKSPPAPAAASPS